MLKWDVLLTSSKVVIPFAIDAYSIKALNEVITYINDAKKANKSLEISKLVPTKFISISKIQKEVINQLREVFDGFSISDTYIPNSIQPSSSILIDNKPILLTKRKGKIVEALKSLYEEIMQEKEN